MCGQLDLTLLPIEVSSLLLLLALLLPVHVGFSIVHVLYWILLVLTMLKCFLSFLYSQVECLSWPSPLTFETGTSLRPFM